MYLHFWCDLANVANYDSFAIFFLTNIKSVKGVWICCAVGSTQRHIDRILSFNIPTNFFIGDFKLVKCCLFVIIFHIFDNYFSMWPLEFWQSENVSLKFQLLLEISLKRSWKHILFRGIPNSDSRKSTSHLNSQRVNYNGHKVNKRYEISHTCPELHWCWFQPNFESFEDPSQSLGIYVL